MLAMRSRRLRFAFSDHDINSTAYRHGLLSRASRRADDLPISYALTIVMLLSSERRRRAGAVPMPTPRSAATAPGRVGPALARRASHRSVRARLRHTARPVKGSLRDGCHALIA
jgi:hypothetical protein